MPCMGPIMQSEDEVKKVTNRLLEVLRLEFHVGVQPLDQPRIFCDMADKYREQLKKWVKEALDNERCASF